MPAGKLPGRDAAEVEADVENTDMTGRYCQRQYAGPELTSAASEEAPPSTCMIQAESTSYRRVAEGGEERKRKKKKFMKTSE